MKIVFISSLARSGSSALALLLGTHPDLISLGEIYNVLGPKFDVLTSAESKTNCTCGSHPTECNFWGPALSELMLHRTDSVPARYERLLNIFRSTFGPQAIPVDSSKQLVALKAVLSVVKPSETRVLHLLRDVRSWTATGRKKEITVRVLSQQEIARNQETEDARLVELETAPYDMLSRGYTVRRNHDGNGRPAGFDVVLDVPRSNGHSPTRLFLVWYVRNRQIGAFLKSKAVPHFSVGYEEFAIKTEPVMRKVYDFLELDAEPDVGQLEATNSHAITGNRMIRDEHRRAKLEYDPDWLYGETWNKQILLFPFVARYNAENVYRNLSHGSCR